MKIKYGRCMRCFANSSCFAAHFSKDWHIFGNHKLLETNINLKYTCSNVYVAMCVSCIFSEGYGEKHNKKKKYIKIWHGMVQTLFKFILCVWGKWNKKGLFYNIWDNIALQFEKG